MNISQYYLQKISVISVISCLIACSSNVNVDQHSVEVTKPNIQSIVPHSEVQTTSDSNKSFLTSTSKKSKVFKENGLASYYGNSLNGHKTANGEIFNNEKLTAAHKYLPFGSFVKVTALWNKRSVVVRINDRGPYPKGRIIDISKAAAEKIGLVGKGIGKVDIEVVNKP